MFDRLIDDAAMFPPGNAPVAEAIAEHRAYREAWFAPLIGPLVVPDTQLAAVGQALRQAEGSGKVSVSVVNTSGAGGLVALVGRAVDGVEIVAVETALRDFEDLEGNAQRVVSAAAELDEDVAVFVELPYAPGWESAMAVVEEAGHLGKIRTGGLEPTDFPSPDRLAEQLSVLVEADLPFKATAGLHHAQPIPGADADRPVQHGFLNVLAAVEALVGGASVEDAVAVLRQVDPAAIAAWTDDTVDRVRRRFRSFGCCGVLDPVGDLVALGLVEEAAP